MNLHVFSLRAKLHSWTPLLTLALVLGLAQSLDSRADTGDANSHSLRFASRQDNADENRRRPPSRAAR